MPIVFAVDGEVIYTAVDGKPKSSVRLRRLANIEADPRVSILADHYADDWSQLWWVRADGIATVLADGPECERGLELLRAKYPQYAERFVGRTGDRGGGPEVVIVAGAPRST